MAYKDPESKRRYEREYAARRRGERLAELVCTRCSTQLLEPSPSGMCGLCIGELEERAEREATA